LRALGATRLHSNPNQPLRRRAATSRKRLLLFGSPELTKKAQANLLKGSQIQRFPLRIRVFTRIMT
jgi:hypothetical protein